MMRWWLGSQLLCCVYFTIASSTANYSIWCFLLWKIAIWILS